MTTYTFTRGRTNHERGSAGANNTPALRDYDVQVQTALTSAFDRTALFAAIALARNWESFENLDYDIADLGWHLLYPTASSTFEETVTEVLGSSYSSSEMQVNAAQGRNITPIPWAKISDSSYWFLMSKVEKPLVLWDRQGAEQTMVVDEVG